MIWVSHEPFLHWASESCFEHRSAEAHPTEAVFERQGKDCSSTRKSESQRQHCAGYPHTSCSPLRAPTASLPASAQSPFARPESQENILYCVKMRNEQEKVHRDDASTFNFAIHLYKSSMSRTLVLYRKQHGLMFLQVVSRLENTCNNIPRASVALNDKRCTKGGFRLHNATVISDLNMLSFNT